MTIVRVGTNKKYADGWAAAFGRGKAASQAKTPKAKPAAVAKKPARKAAKKKR